MKDEKTTTKPAFDPEVPPLTGRHHNALRGERFYLVDRGGFPQ